MHEVVKIVDGQLIRTIDGEEVERRPAAAWETAAPPAEPAPPVNEGPDLPAIADQVAALTDAVNLLILNSLGV